MSYVTASIRTRHGNWQRTELHWGPFAALLLFIVGGAIVRSAVATRLDGFTIDEAYHIAAGVSYVRYADFRINPEQPPLVKLWVGAFMAPTGFRLESIRPFADKADERDFTEEDVYFNNDFNLVQRRARVAMWALNGFLLLLLAIALRRSFGSGVALGTLLILAIDPTVAAHLPVVMMDLPVSLLAASAVALAIRAFLTGTWADVLVCAAVLGLTLGAKHSAPVFLMVVILTGAVAALVAPVPQSAGSLSLRLGKLVVVVAGAWLSCGAVIFSAMPRAIRGKRCSIARLRARSRMSIRAHTVPCLRRWPELTPSRAPTSGALRTRFAPVWKAARTPSRRLVAPTSEARLATISRR